MPFDRGPNASDIASLADEAASLFDSVITLGGSMKGITFRLKNSLIRLIETLRAFHDFRDKLLAESYLSEAMRAHMDGISDWLTDLRQTLHRGSPEVIEDRQNDDAGALESSLPLQTSTDRDASSSLEQTLTPWLNELTLILHLYQGCVRIKPPF